MPCGGSDGTPVRTAKALELVRHRDRVLVEVLESERDQGMPAPFDWRAWRRNRAALVVRLTNERRSVHTPVDE